MATVLGTSIKRREDPRLITGQAQYIEDIKLPGMLHAAILRSAFGHAKIKSINTEEARKLPGVVAVFTGQDFKDVPAMPCAMPAGGGKNITNTARVLALDKVTWTGAGVAVVVAEDRYIAEDALNLIQVDYEQLPAVVDAEKATQPGAPQIHENAPNNIAVDWEAGNKAATEQALKEADVVVKQRLVNQRLIPNAIEPRGAIAQYTPSSEEWTIWLTSQAPHVHRLLIAAFVLGVPEHKIRVIAPQVGGGFGSKIFLYPEYCLMALLSRKLGRPVKWMETRRENYVATTHGRDHITYIEVGAKRDGQVTALKVLTYANLGGVLSTISPGVTATLYGRMVSGPYKLRHVYNHLLGVYTNTAMVDAYRGAGRPEATYLLERAMDLVARELNMDPAEVRRKNFIQPQDFPYAPADDLLAGLKYDSGNYERTLDRALEMVDYKNLRAEQEEARKEGRLVGIGFSSYVEICGLAPTAWANGQGWGAGLWESANVRMHLTGKVVVTTGLSPHGQGHETTLAQLTASELGIPVEDVIVQANDTLGTPFGLGTYGSRSAAVGGTAVHRANQRIIDKAKRIAAHMLEANPDDLVYEDGKMFVRGAPAKTKTIQEIGLAAAVGAGLPEGVEPYLDETSYYDPPDCTFPFGTHICVVEVDKDTGQVEIKRYIAVDDVGNVINPMIVDGQVHGGVAQGIAQALYEGAVYDENGTLLSGSLLDYAVPTAAMLPKYEHDRLVTPSPVNPLGIKGAGETGTIASTPAVVNAVVDALAPLGIKNLDMPLTPQKVWNAMQAKGGM
jgi:aerobic carbon-monoxide dehydrogenase large subunit